jgi:hypothetical protein
MFIILEHNGDYIMGVMIDEEGETEKFDTLKQAEKFAEKECAFEYKIVQI